MQRIFKGTKLNETHFSSRRILEDYSVDPLFPTTTLVWVLESNGWVRIAEMEATGHARWFERLLAELQFELWIGDAAKIKAARVRNQKTDRQDALLLLKLLIEDRFPRIWVPSTENRDSYY